MKEVNEEQFSSSFSFVSCRSKLFQQKLDASYLKAIFEIFNAPCGTNTTTWFRKIWEIKNIHFFFLQNASQPLSTKRRNQKHNSQPIPHLFLYPHHIYSPWYAIDTVHYFPPLTFIFVKWSKVKSTYIHTYIHYRLD